jgi:cobalamin synthase
MSEADHFRDAWRFLTIVRIPESSQPIAADWLARSLKYFPAVGICIGIISAAAAKALAVARPARKVRTIAAVTSDGYCETPSWVRP